ncbi:MAG: 3-keto-disaccharide hydrolase [Woeseiaceae bacterium]
MKLSPVASHATPLYHRGMIRNAMLTRATTVFVAFLSTSAALAADPPSAGFADPVLGRWDITVQGSDGAYPSWLELQLRTERQLMGRLVGQFGSVRHAAAITYEDNQLKVRVPVQYEGGDDDLVFTGSVANAELTGTVRMADGAVLDWHGVRAPALNRKHRIQWGEPISLISDDLSDWHLRDDRNPGCWSVTNGILKVTPPCADIISNATFDDFRLELEFRYPPGSNSGVYLRGRYEVQIQDDHGKALDPLRLGGVYGFLAPEVDASRPAGEWQTYDIELVGRTINATLNGNRILTNRVIPGITGGALDSNEGSAGPLMLQGDHGPIEYRNVVLTPGH